ncbi:MAG: septum formation protein Maf [Proteobacteria bacterium]|nr:septum formation protein Maf [Pseudomonadota bacterium]MBU1610624.1 septum formation protein Maf [Pseudomonadota bacterium]
MTQHAIFTTRIPLVLASGSPRRKSFLDNLGLQFETLPSPVDEPEPEAGESPEAYAVRLACLKAMDIATKHPEAAVLGSDTVVALGEVILGKPKDDADALRMLTLLSGQTHVVVTGCCLMLPGGEIERFHGRTDVRMRRSGPTELEAYVATGEPADKAGAYAIQGIGAFLVEHVEGSYTNVVGLPLARTLEVLLSWGVIAPRKG